MLCSGQAPQEVVPHLCGANLFALRKKGGGLRPIAVSKCISRAVRGEAFRALTPLQVGVGVAVGCEAIMYNHVFSTLASRQFLQHNNHT